MTWGEHIYQSLVTTAFLAVVSSSRVTISLIPFVCMCVNLFKLFEAIYLKGDSRVSNFDKRGGQIYFLTPSPALCWVVVNSLSGNQAHSCFVLIMI